MRRPTGAARLAAVLLALVPAALAAQANPLGDWPQHSKARPRPPVVAPGTGALPVPPPADAIVLFDGKNLDEWQKGDSTPAQWRLVEGQAMQVTAGKGGIETKRRFGDAQLHIEWASPKPAKGTDQDRGNSGVFFQGRYEVQVLDSYGNDTYPDGQAAAIYGQYPPLVNASRAPGEWQSYDITFVDQHLTVVFNGKRVIDNQPVLGCTGGALWSNESRPGPIYLQGDHSDVEYRNLVLRPVVK
ncbi:MAG TPA: DUF1080 domain-containing protein [Verrucomicrobiales bacterium]|nr:DUF1080 domain-containing protein [Verrucomicrobiales bacterium]